MSGFTEYGEAMLLANDGNVHLANALTDSVKRLFSGARGWVRGMPATLPPTESFEPK